MITDNLGKMDADYKKHINAILTEVQTRLHATTGYMIVATDAIVGCKHGKRDEYLLVNTITNRMHLQSITQARCLQQQTTVPFDGFKFVIFHLILKSNSGRATLAEILQEIRKLDSRFTETISKTTTSSSIRSSSTHVVSGVPGLEDNLVGLLQRMKKVCY
jgi:hypothetical protein